MEFWLKKQAEINGDGIFLDDGNVRYNFYDTYQYASKLAFVLSKLNRNRIGLYIDNTIKSALLINACWVAGIEIALLNTRLTKREMQDQMASVEIDTIITINDLKIDGFHIAKFESLEAEIAEQYFETTFSLENIASIMFTSGTTGPQKAVPQTFSNHYASALGCKESLGFNGQTKWLSVLPIYHISGLSVLLRGLIEGFTVRLEKKFDTIYMLKIIKDEHPTHVSLVPQTLKWLMEGGLTEPYQIEKILLGGAKLSSSLIEQALSYNLPIYNSFGMTETCSQFLTASPDMLKDRFDTVGKPSGNIAVKIKNPNDQGHGELLIKGDNVMKGYLYPKHISNTFDEEGYFKTGDIAEINHEGYVMVYDRRKDLIISGGENIYPYQIETIAKQYPGIEDALCIGMKDDEWGEVPMLYYVSNYEVSNEDLMRHFENNVAKFKVPKQFNHVKSLPYTSTGKLQRNRFKK
ncbi:o-succinylbenzoate--CoA ligase [Staphylococcus sp. ACRSN]|uniref:o-succinylbenzoate--CoA ligase n=1 Tax=Staphylococcus sp. ACRSN TaxID=2918214 RepID=UPI001EF170EF|nr:o-succinylbenzoate--CoA ligase [Staphylococcus sp. ACRSN]